jgi:hypothetical protein
MGACCELMIFYSLKFRFLEAAMDLTDKGRVQRLIFGWWGMAQTSSNHGRAFLLIAEAVLQPDHLDVRDGRIFVSISLV